MLVLRHVMDIPTFGGFLRVLRFAKLANEDSVRQPMQVNVVVLRGRNYESVTLYVWMLYDLDCVDESFVGNDEDFFYEVDLSRLVIEIHVFNVPNFQLTRCITCH